jgi:hypothetical protein
MADALPLPVGLMVAPIAQPVIVTLWPRAAILQCAHKPARDWRRGVIILAHSRLDRFTRVSMIAKLALILVILRGQTISK